MTGPQFDQLAESIVLPNEGEWMLESACLGVATSVMFPEPGKGTPYDDTAAKALCAKCPVRDECLEYALAWPEASDRYGIFGGMNPAERRRVRKVRAGRPSKQRRSSLPRINDRLGQIGETHRRAVERLQTLQ